MSVKRISGHILSGVLDGKLTKEETEKILSQQDNAWKAPESVGTFVSKREHQLIEDLKQCQIRRSERGRRKRANA